jgi:hypothetical protein
MQISGLRQRLASALLFLTPITLLFGENPVFRSNGLPFYWSLFAFLLFLGAALPEILTEGRQRLRSIPLAIWIGGALIVVGVGISLLVAQDTKEAVAAGLMWFLVPLCFMLSIFMSGYSVLPLVAGIVTHALLQTVYGAILLPDQLEPRLQGAFSSPNFYAATVVPALFLTLLLPGRWKWAAVVVRV